MKKMSKLLSVFMALTMVTALMSTMAMAASVTEVGTYDALVKAVANDGEIKLTADIELTSSVEVAKGKIVTLDLNGHTLSFASPAPNTTYLLYNKGTLTIKDSSEGQTGLMTTYAENPDIDWGSEGYPTYANNTVNNTGVLTIQSGTLENTCTSGGATYVIDNYAGGTLNVEGGKIINKNNFAIRMNTASATAANTVNVSGGVIEGTRAIWIHLAGSTKTVAPEVNLTVTGGTLNGTKVDSSDNKLAVYSYSYGNDMKNVKINISGGDFYGDVALTGGANKDNIETVNVTGGTFVGRWGDVYSYGADAKAKEAVKISGGAFTSNEVVAYLEDGYVIKNVDGYYVVSKKAAEATAAGTTTVATTTTETAGTVSGSATGDATVAQDVADAVATTTNANSDTQADLATAIITSDENTVTDSIIEQYVTVETGKTVAEAVEEKLTEASITTNNDVAIVVQPSMQVEVKDVKTDSTDSTVVTSITVDITPVYDIVATTQDVVDDENTDIEVGTNAVKLNDEPIEMAVEIPVTVSIPVPEALADNGEKVLVAHKGKTGFFVHKVEVENNSVTFTNKNGFSEFTVTGAVDAEDVKEALEKTDCTVVDLGGTTVELSEAVTIENKTLTIKNGIMNTTATWQVNGTAELTLEAVTFNAAVRGMSINDEAKVTLGAGTKMVSANHTFRLYDSSVLTIDGGEIEHTTTNHAIAPTQNSTINLISGSVVSNVGNAIQTVGGTLNMQGGKLESKSSKHQAIVVTKHATQPAIYNGPVTLNISGGTVEGSVRFADVATAERPFTLSISGNSIIKGDGTKAIDSDDAARLTGAALTGGSFTGKVELVGLAKVITGGTFNDGVEASYIADNYTLFADKTVRLTSAAEAKIGETYYITLKAAVEDTEATGDIVLLKDVTLTEGLDASGKTLDLGTYSIKLDTNGTLKAAENLNVIPAAASGYIVQYKEGTYSAVAGGSVKISSIPDGAIIEVKDSSANPVSGTNGVYTLPNGTYSYTVTKTGYDTQSGDFNIDGADLPDITVELVETKYDVTITATPDGASIVVKNSSGIAMDLTEGVYKLVSGAYTYTVSKDGYESKDGEFTVDAENLEITVVLDQLYDVIISANPANATVVVKKDGQVVTEVGGVYKLTAGTYTYTVSKSGYETKTENFDVDGNAAIQVTLTEAPVVVTTYRVVVADAENGTVTLSRTRASRNSLITITATPDAGYKVAKVEVTNFRGEEVAVTDAGNGTYTFRMPGSTTNVTVTFESTSSISHLTDVAADKWYYSAVEYAVSNGLMVGTAEDKFSPEAAMERAMVIQVLYNMENTPAVTYTGKFSDVADGKWYTNAIEWGVANGILVDYGTAFDPNGAISREEMVRMMYNYARYKGKDTSARGDLSKYTDGATTSDWAVEYVKWAVGSGVMVGGETILNPTGNANRAEVAQIFKNFHELYSK